MKFVFDLDGTLCFDGMTMSKELQEVLLTAPKYGHEIIFATARSYRDCLSILEGELKKLTVVGLNSGEVFQDECLVSQYTIPSHALRTIVSYCDTYNLPYFIDDTVVITISVDLPFAQARWCGAEGLENAIMLSDYYDNSFGKDYGVLIEEWHLLARAVLVADADNKITYVEYLDNINTDPNYEAAVAAVKSL